MHVQVLNLKKVELALTALRFFYLSGAIQTTIIITTEAITTIQTQKNCINHFVLQSLCIVSIELKLFFSDFQASDVNA